MRMKDLYVDGMKACGPTTGIARQWRRPFRHSPSVVATTSMQCGFAPHRPRSHISCIPANYGHLSPDESSAPPRLRDAELTRGDHVGQPYTHARSGLLARASVTHNSVLRGPLLRHHGPSRNHPPVRTSHARSARGDRARRLFQARPTANASLHLGRHVIEKRFKLGRRKPLRLRRLVAVIKFDAFSDQHFHGVAIVRRVVPLELEADRTVTAEDKVDVRDRRI